MRRTIATIMLACAIGASIVGALSGAHAGLVIFGLLLAVSATALAAALALRGHGGRIGSLHRQLALAVGIPVGAILIAVWVAAAVMFISAEDARVVSVMAAVIAVVGVRVASVLTDPLVSDIELLRERLRAVGVGERSTDLVLGGSDELADLAAATNAMIEQLVREEQGREASDEARKRLIIAVSHDLRTPIAALRVLVEAIQDRIATGATRTRYLGEIQTHVAILSALIDDLFELTRAQSGEIKPSTEAVEIGELVSETVTAMLATGEEHGVTLHVQPRAGHAPGVTLTARADADQIRRVLLNLLDNSLHHTPPGGEVVVHTSLRGSKVQVEVADDGTGIPAADREHVFEAFFRGAEHTSRSDHGTGLGLAIARAIVNAHRGEIWLAPAQRGTRVCFSLPALAEQSPQTPTAPRSANPVAPTAIASTVGEVGRGEERSLDARAGRRSAVHR
jgi:signal transduction histidine kinase